MSRFLRLLLLVALSVAPACSEGPTGEPTPEAAPSVAPPRTRPDRPPSVQPVDLPFPDDFRRSLSKAPAETQKKILATCGKWKRPDGACDDKAVREEQIRCWWKRGERELKYTQDVGFKRRRAIDHRIMLLQDLCMEMHGWELRHRRGGG